MLCISFNLSSITTTNSGQISFISCNQNWDEIDCKVPSIKLITDKESSIKTFTFDSISAMEKRDMVIVFDYSQKK